MELWGAGRPQSGQDGAKMVPIMEPKSGPIVPDSYPELRVARTEPKRIDLGTDFDQNGSQDDQNGAKRDLGAP